LPELEVKIEHVAGDRPAERKVDAELRGGGVGYEKRVRVVREWRPGEVA